MARWRLLVLAGLLPATAAAQSPPAVTVAGRCSDE
jgi:hypothetical protein